MGIILIKMLKYVMHRSSTNGLSLFQILLFGLDATWAYESRLPKQVLELIEVELGGMWYMYVIELAYQLQNW